MANEDAIRWNARYRKAKEDRYPDPRSFLTEHIQWIGKPGTALEIAMGMGANAKFLSEKGWNVIGLDISTEAVFRAKSCCPKIEAAVIDLEQLQLPVSYFDLILNLYYLDRVLWSGYRQSIKTGGFLMMETLLQEMMVFNQDINPKYLLQPGELKQAFHDWEILYYHEGWVKSDHGYEKAVASLIARKP